MCIASLTFSSPQWLWPTAALSVFAVALLWWSYRRTPPGLIRWTCVLLKLVGIALLALCLLEPLWTGQRVRPGANWFAVIVDTSQGMQIRDVGKSQSRAEELQALLKTDPTGWQAAIEDDFTLRRFTVDSRLSAVRDFDGLEFEGRSSALNSSLGGLQDRFRGKPLAGVLLFTDGNATDSPGASADLSGLAPVYPVVMGRSGGVRDVAIANVHVAQTAFEDAPVTLQADVRVIGLPGETVVARLIDSAGTTMRKETGRAKRAVDTLFFRFQVRPEDRQVLFYRLEVALEAEASADSPVESSEATLLNNSRIVTVDRTGGPYRVLYVTGRPNWEYKFLNRALADDPELQLVGLIRVARREARFDFRGRSGETSNPLFRGVEDQIPEEIERYDEPVLMRLNTRDEFELRAGFPGNPDELYGYDAVILDDLESGFFTRDQMYLLQRYVSERGGGLLMLGGMESFQNGSYRQTPIGEMLPVYLDVAEARPPDSAVRINLTREGWLEAWARLRSNEQDETVRLQSMPPFQVLNRVGDMKPGASAVITAVDEQNQVYPVLVTQRYGRGRTAALTVGDIWRWGMHSKEAHADMDKFWRQLARWLVADVPKRLEFTVREDAGQGNGAEALQIRVRNAQFEPVDDASAIIEVEDGFLVNTNTVQTNRVRLRAEESSKEPGLYEAEYVPHQTGGFRAVARITDSSGNALGEVESGWSSDLAAKEFASMEPNISLLEDIARRTGGEIVSADGLRDFVRELPQRDSAVMEPWTRPAWHTPWLFLLALACFIAEWGVRRRRGMP